MRFLRAFVFGLLATILSILAFLAAAVGLLIDPGGGRLGHAVAKLWARSMLFASGARLVVEHAERWTPREPRVLVANHASYLDIPAMMCVFPGQLRIVARRNLVRIPFVGWFIALGGHFLIDRDDPRQALRLMAEIERRMRRRGLSALVYPEGTRSPDGRLGTLKAGAFHLPLSVGVPLQPIAILGTRHVLPKGAWFPVASGTIVVRVGDPIPVTPAEGGAARKALAEQAERALIGLGVPPRSA